MMRVPPPSSRPAWPLRGVFAIAVLASLRCSVLAPEPGSSAAGGDAGHGDAGLADSHDLLEAASPPDGSGDAYESGVAFACSGDVALTEMVAVPAGAYIIGCNAVVDSECLSDELPMHTVQLSAFSIERTEVTQAQYGACVTAGSCGAPSCAWECGRGAYPANCVVWAQAKEYCAWAGRRLPSEAEWEAAARGPNGQKYPWGNQAPDCALANMLGCSGESDAVGSHPTGASPFGALDMAGNMVEMVEDWFSPTYYSVSPTDDPTGPTTGTTYGGRGGGYLSEAVWQRASSRDWYDLTDEYASLGFRCAD